MSKRILLSGYYGFDNLGDDLILDVLVQQLKAYGATPIVLSDKPRETEETYGVESILRTEIPRIWHAMGDADAFLSGGGGLFQDVTGWASPIYYGGLIEMASWRHLPVAIFGQGVGPLRTLLGKLCLWRAVSHASLLVVRDVKSQAIVQQATGRKAELMADSVWLWQPTKPLKVSFQKGIAVSLRPWPSLQDSDIDHLAECLSGLPEARDGGVNLIDCQPSSDILPLSRLEKTLKAKQIACQWFSGATATQGMAQSSAFVGMRFHAVLMAAQLGLPMAAISYDPKVQLLAAQLKIADFPVNDLVTLTPQALRDSWVSADTETVGQFRKSAALGFSWLQQWLEALP